MAVCSPSLVMVVNVSNIHDVDNKKKYNLKGRNPNFKIHQNLLSMYLKNISFQLGVQNENIIHAIKKIVLFQNVKELIREKCFALVPLRNGTIYKFSKKK